MTTETTWANFVNEIAEAAPPPKPAATSSPK